MKKRFLFTGAAALLLGAVGIQPTQPAPVVSTGTTKSVQPTDSTSRTPKAPVAKAQSVAARARRAGGIIGAPVFFIERPSLRRVKYGKRRWILLS